MPGAPATRAAKSHTTPSTTRIGVTTSARSRSECRVIAGRPAGATRRSRPAAARAARSTCARAPRAGSRQRSASRCDGSLSGCVRSSIRPTPFVEEPVADEPHRARHQSAPPARGAGEVGDLVVVAVPSRGDHCTDGDVGRRLGDGEVEPIARYASVVREAQERVEVAVARGSAGMFSHVRTSGSRIVERTTARSSSRNSRRTTTPSVSDLGARRAMVSDTDGVRPEFDERRLTPPSADRPIRYATLRAHGAGRRGHRRGRRRGAAAPREARAAGRPSPARRAPPGRRRRRSRASGRA